MQCELRPKPPSGTQPTVTAEFAEEHHDASLALVQPASPAVVLSHMSQGHGHGHG
jgi:hypothetical protein